MMLQADCATRPKRTALFLLALALACAPARADNPPDTPDVVRVTALRAIPWKSYRALRAAMDAYEQHKHLAPDAGFSFGVVLPPNVNLPTNFAMRVRTPEGREYPITMDGKLFKLPMLPDGMLDADLVSNLKGIAVKIGIHIETPGVPPGMDRLGDLRLTCEIEYAIHGVEDGFFARMLRPNACETPKGGYWTYARSDLPRTGTTLVDGAHTAALKGHDDSNGTRYRMPLYDANWSDDTLVDYGYLTPFPARVAARALRFTVEN